MNHSILSHSKQTNNTEPWRQHLVDWFHTRAFRLRRQASAASDPAERRRLLALSAKMSTAAKRAGGRG